MKDTIYKRLGNLLSVKSLVTLTLTAVFAYMSVKGDISQDFMTVYVVVISFYFGTQSTKLQQMLDKPGEENIDAEDELLLNERVLYDAKRASEEKNGNS